MDPPRIARVETAVGSGFRETVGVHARFFAPQGELTAARRAHAVGEGEAFEERTRYDEIEVHVLRVLLEAGGGVEDVAHEHDLPAEIAEFAARDGAAVKPATEARDGAKLALVARRMAGHGGADAEEAADAVGRTESRVQPPRHHDFIARVLVDLRVGLQHGLGQVVHEAAEQLEVPRAPQLLGETGGTLEVEDEEDALLGAGVMKDARHEIAEDVGADQAVHLEDELY